MELVIDANILFAILIRDSYTANLVFKNNITLIAPEFLIEEFFKHEKLIISKLKRTREEFVQIMHQLNDIIRIIPSEEYENNLNTALEITPDENDAMYFALAIKLKCDIWSNDAKLK
jgi:predicted nucleic acid-binding protein